MKERANRSQRADFVAFLPHLFCIGGRAGKLNPRAEQAP